MSYTVTFSISTTDIASFNNRVKNVYITLEIISKLKTMLPTQTCHIFKVELKDVKKTSVKNVVSQCLY